jgi:hypothetical protein
LTNRCFGATSLPCRQALERLRRYLHIAEDNNLADCRDGRALYFRAILADHQVLASFADMQLSSPFGNSRDGQAIVSFPHMTRPLLVAIDPTPAELRMVD